MASAGSGRSWLAESSRAAMEAVFRSNPMQRSVSLATTGAVLLSALSAAQPAQAGGGFNLTQAANPTAWCQPATPFSDGFMRKRPLAIQNEGTAASFVTCSIPLLLGGPISLRVEASSFNGTEGATVSCTMVSGSYEVGVEPRRITKSLSINDDNSVNTVQWDGPDFEGLTLNDGLVNLSCLLPPGTGLNRITLVNRQGDPEPPAP